MGRETSRRPPEPPAVPQNRAQRPHWPCPAREERGTAGKGRGTEAAAAKSPRPHGTDGAGGGAVAATLQLPPQTPPTAQADRAQSAPQAAAIPARRSPTPPGLGSLPQNRGHPPQAPLHQAQDTKAPTLVLDRPRAPATPRPKGLGIWNLRPSGPRRGYLEPQNLRAFFWPRPKGFEVRGCVWMECRHASRGAHMRV